MNAPHSISLGRSGLSVGRLFCSLIVAIFTMEAAVMFLLTYAIPAWTPGWVDAFLDATLLSLGSAPMLW